ncbi:MAG: hypothetical protein EP332_12185 [Bacteroidetes bacterium]|nr:MAG: hypothetical protein EP332_12185 [Bacteroidota bacterium]
MKAQNTEDYIAQAEDFAQPVLRHLRQLVHQSGLAIEEQIKWQFPCFLYKGKILCNIAAFKQHCSFGFWQGKLLSDHANILEKSGENTAMGQLGKIKSLADLPSDEILLSYLHEAAELIDKGVKNPVKQAEEKPNIAMHPAFKKALESDRIAMANFQQMPPSHQREYLAYISEAKKEETQLRRVEKSIQLLHEAKGLNDKYQKK